jgi:hypothetical protein
MHPEAQKATSADDLAKGGGQRPHADKVSNQSDANAKQAAGEGRRQADWGGGDLGGGGSALEHRGSPLGMSHSLTALAIDQ